MPLVLLENEVSQKDMSEFFVGDGDVFRPWLVLRGTDLGKLKRPDGRGKNEMLESRPLLDIAAFQKYQLISANYDTITNYQFSFAAQRNWSVIITDEAQEYKTPSTKISCALKTLDPYFRVACTGTPVETRLSDVWNIVDFLQPGFPMSLSDFTHEFERPYLDAVQPAKAGEVLKKLHDIFRIGQSDAWIMRRDKRHHLEGLPKKLEHRLEAPLSDEQRQMHLELMKSAHDDQAHPFKLLNDLMAICQRPALSPHYEGISAREAIAQCPKLAKVIDQLKEIRRSNEKVLIFALRKSMQQILKNAIDNEFNLQLDIINGDHAAGDGNGGRATRKTMLDRFRTHPGFNVIILSPVVAGLGLTLIKANHVIHYGRWWNPALEAQATDRVYRIGQEKTVHVYYPIASDPAFTTFDEKLDRIIKRRQTMAQDFLTPLLAEQQIEEELLGEVLQVANT